jgi:hypothetical protein
VGNAAFVSRFQQAVPEHWRVVRADDALPSLPRTSMGCRHVPRAVALVGNDAALKVALPDRARLVWCQGVCEAIPRVVRNPLRP